MRSSKQHLCSMVQPERRAKTRKVANPLPAGDDPSAIFSAQLAELQQHASSQHSAWASALEAVQGVAAVSDSDLLAEGRRVAERLYGSVAAHFWPEPPSVSFTAEFGFRVRVGLERTLLLLQELAHHRAGRQPEPEPESEPESEPEPEP